MNSCLEIKRRQSRGVTLVEMLAVLAIIAITMAILSPLVRQPQAKGAAMRDAAAVAAAIREARAEALSTGADVEFAIDFKNRTYGVRNRSPIQLFSNSQVQFTGASEVQHAAGEGVIRLYADGSTSGGKVTLVSGNEENEVIVDWLGGSVRVARGNSK